MEQQPISEVTADEGPPAREDIWRQEVQERVSGYRTRRGRPIEGAFSMRFPFPPAEEAVLSNAEPLPTGAVTESESLDGATATPAPELALCVEDLAQIQPDPSPPTAPAIDPQPSPAPRPRGKRKVIAFPKPLVAEPDYPGSDSVLPEQPRIFEVPQELEAYATTPLLDGLLFPSQQRESKPAPADHLELPLQPASISQRLYAALMDCAMVLAGVLLFAAVSFKLLPRFTLNKPAVLTAVVLPVLLWAAYQYLLLVYGGETIGMRMAGICLRSFNGEQPKARQRRNRAIGLYFSAASLMMGVFWALVDVDTLGWHDRISRTYLTRQATSN